MRDLKDDADRIRWMREAHERDCIARGVHDATLCARTVFTEAEPACPDVDEHLALDYLVAPEDLALFVRLAHGIVKRRRMRGQSRVYNDPLDLVEAVAKKYERS